MAWRTERATLPDGIDAALVDNGTHAVALIDGKLPPWEAEDVAFRLFTHGDEPTGPLRVLASL